MRRTSETKNQSRRRANRRPPGPGSPESRERGNASAGEGRIGCAMTRATRIAAAHAAGGRVRSTEPATVPHAGTTPPVLSPRSPTSRSLASSEGSSPYEPGQPGRGRQHRDHQLRSTSFGRRLTHHRIKRRRRRSPGAVVGRRGNLHRNRRSQASPQPRRPRTQQERLWRGSRHREQRRRGGCSDPGRAVGRRTGTCRHAGRRRIRPGSSSPARTNVHAPHDPQGRYDPQDRRDPQDRLDPQGSGDDDRRSGIARDTGIRGWRIRVAHRYPEAASPSRRPRTRRGRRWRPRGHHRREHAYRLAHVRRKAAASARHRRRCG